MTLKIRKTQPADAFLLTDILHRSKGVWGYGDDKMADFRCAFRISAKDLVQGEFIVAEQNGKPVGFAGGLRLKDEFRMDYLFVSPEAVGREIGCLLLARLEDLVRALEISSIRLESDYHAAGFYEKNGYRVTGHRPSHMSPTGEIPIMEKQLNLSAVPLKSIQLRLADIHEWHFDQTFSAEISQHWSELLRQNPALWNGEVLKVSSLSFEGGHLSGQCQKGSFASHLAWRDWGSPTLTDFNLFGSAVIRTADGALLYGVMADHTANAGRIYPPGGNLDLSDINFETGKVDILASTLRELEEETGLQSRELTPTGLLAVFDGPSISIASLFDVNHEAAPLRDRIIAHSMASEEQELKDIFIIRGEEALSNPNLKPWSRPLARAALAQSRTQAKTSD